MSPEAEEIIEWGRELAQGRPYLLHVPTRVIGRVAKFYDGENERAVSSNNDRPVEGPVIEIEPGHRLVANPEHFIELDENEVRFFVGVQASLNAALSELVRVGAGLGVKLPTITVILIGALQAQIFSVQPRGGAEITW